MSMLLASAGYVPLLHPILAFYTWWYLLLIPLSFGISMIYKAMRVHDLRTYWREVAAMTAQVIVAMIALALALVVLVVFIIPRLPVA